MNSLALSYKGLTLHRSGRTDLSKKLLDDALSISPNDIYIHINKIECTDDKEKEQVLKDAIKYFPSNLYLHWQFAIFYHSRDSDKAIMYLKKCKELISNKNSSDYYLFDNLINIWGSNINEILLKSLTRLEKRLRKGLAKAKKLLQLHDLCVKLISDAEDIYNQFSSNNVDSKLFSLIQFHVELFNSVLKLLKCEYSKINLTQLHKNALNLVNDFKWARSLDFHYFIEDLTYIKKTLKISKINDIYSIPHCIERHILEVLKYTQNRIVECSFEEYIRYYKKNRRSSRKIEYIEDLILYDLDNFEKKLDEINSSRILREEIVKIWIAYGVSVINKYVDTAIIEKKILEFKKLNISHRKVERYLKKYKATQYKKEKLNTLLNEILKTFFISEFENQVNRTKWFINNSDFRS